MERIFLTHAAADLNMARRLASDLGDQGFDVRAETLLAAFGSLQGTAGDEIRQAKAIIVLVSPASLSMDWQTDALSRALGSGERIIPVLINGASFWHVPSGLHVDVLDLNTYPAGGGTALRQLTDRLRDVVSSHTAPADPVDIDQAVEEAVDDAVKRTLEQYGIEPQTAVPEPSNRVFIIISFAPEMEPVVDAIKSAAAKVGLEAKRISDEPGDYLITETIMRRIDSARMIVADLTGERQNVYFELGYARGKGKTVVTLLRKGQRPHFDVQGWTRLEYIDSRPLEKDLVERFRSELGAASEAG